MWSGTGELLSPAWVDEAVLRPIHDGVPGADRVGLLHPVELADDVLSHLREVAASRGLQPPFAQLEREKQTAHLYWIERRFERGVTAELVHSGIDCGDAPPSSVKLIALRFRGAAGLVTLSEIPARCVSEAIRDALELASATR